MLRIFTTALFASIALTCNAQRDSLRIFLNDTQFRTIEPELTEISETDFYAYRDADTLRCTISAGNFISGHGLYVKDTCHEICTTSLVDSTSRKSMRMPSSFDQGIIGFHISPQCTQFLVYSTYDGPDYDKYYPHRAEIYGFTVAPGKGLETIQPSFSFFTESWSIDAIVWINETTLALKVYEDSAAFAGHGHVLMYQYFKFELG